MRFCSIILSLFFAGFCIAEIYAQETAPAPTPAETPASAPAETPAPAVPELADTPAPAPAEAPQPNYVQSEEEAIALGPKNKEFMDAYKQFREIAKKLTAWKVEYQTAKPARQAEIDQDYMPLYEEGEKLSKSMVDVGLDAFDEAPNRNPFVGNYLYSHVEWEYRRDNYEVSVKIFKRLVKHGIAPEAKVLYVFGGLSAMMTMDLEDAEAWLKTATESGHLENVMKDYARTEKGREKVMSLEGLFTRIPTFKEDWAKEQEIRKKETEEGETDAAKKLPRVLIKTSKGDIVVELFENQAPGAVANFISLVEKKFYDGTVFHRVLPMFMAQGGDPTGTGMGGPGYTIDCECKRPDYRKHFRGTLSMAHAGANTGGSQFFLTFVPTYFLDGRHTAFGRVVEGFEVLADIQRVDPQDEDSVIPTLDRIIEATVLNKRDHEYAPIKNANRR